MILEHGEVQSAEWQSPGQRAHSGCGRLERIQAGDSFLLALAVPPVWAAPVSQTSHAQCKSPSAPREIGSAPQMGAVAWCLLASIYNPSTLGRQA